MMTRRATIAVWIGIGALAAVCVAGMLLPVVVRGVSARDEPTTLETVVARNMRHFAVPRLMRRAGNPVPLSADVLARGRAHFADHCASCHGNDGRGRTAIGQNLYPKAPDMTLSATQDLSDGELYAIIENGVRLTGMPAWGPSGKVDDLQTWHLVHFIRHLPRLTPEEIETMEELNPLSKQEWKEQEEADRFLRGDAEPPKQAQ
jgi:mono/diheme cytochrome c family protein